MKVALRNIAKEIGQAFGSLTMLGYSQKEVKISDICFCVNTRPEPRVFEPELLLIFLILMRGGEDHQASKDHSEACDQSEETEIGLWARHI